MKSGRIIADTIFNSATREVVIRVQGGGEALE